MKLLFVEKRTSSNTNLKKHLCNTPLLFYHQPLGNYRVLYMRALLLINIIIIKYIFVEDLLCARTQ